MKILDTNVLLRFLVADNKNQQLQAEKWFFQAERGKLEIVVDPIVVAESCFVLESFYERKRIEISESMQVFLSQRWLRVRERDVLLGLWEFYLEDFHFVDSYLLSWSRVNGGKILSFDKKASKRLKST